MPGTSLSLPRTLSVVAPQRPQVVAVRHAVVGAIARIVQRVSQRRVPAGYPEAQLAVTGDVVDRGRAPRGQGSG